MSLFLQILTFRKIILSSPVKFFSHKIQYANRKKNHQKTEININFTIHFYLFNYILSLYLQSHFISSFIFIIHETKKKKNKKTKIDHKNQASTQLGSSRRGNALKLSQRARRTIFFIHSGNQERKIYRSINIIILTARHHALNATSISVCLDRERYVAFIMVFHSKTGGSFFFLSYFRSRAPENSCSSRPKNCYHFFHPVYLHI